MYKILLITLIGIFSRAGRAAVWRCLPCPPGTYSEYGATSCPPCPANHYCLGASGKQPCPSGTYSPAGAMDESECEPCDKPGTWLNNGMCEKCPAGSACPGNEHKNLCYKFDEYSDEEGLAKCKICPPGQITGVGYVTSHNYHECKPCVPDFAKKSMSDAVMKHCRGIPPTTYNYPKTLLYSVNFNDYAVSTALYYKIATFASSGSWHMLMEYSNAIYLPQGTYTLCAVKTSATSNAHLVIEEGTDCPAEFSYNGGITGWTYVANGKGTGYLYRLD